MNRNLYVLVLAGGSGERFWPLSRRQRPKQLLALFSPQTLLEATLARLEGLVPPERMLVLTNQEQEAAVRRCLPTLPEANLVAEPAKRDTAAAIALAAGWIAARDPEATMVVLPADHLISDREGFQQTLRTAAEAAQEEGTIVTIGIEPTWPSPSFGYIECGEEEAPSVFQVKRFREKPSQPEAEGFLAQGGFRWNAGMFVWTLPTLRAALQAHVPELAAFVDRLATGDLATLLREEFPLLPKISIDYAVLEKASRVKMVAAGFDWDDVGSWEAAARYWAKDEAENSHSGALLVEDASRNIVRAEPGVQVTLLGVDDLIVVQTPDAVLVCHRQKAEQIKKIVAKLPESLQ